MILNKKFKIKKKSGKKTKNMKIFENKTVVVVVKHPDFLLKRARQRRKIKNLLDQLIFVCFFFKLFANNF